MTKIYAFPEKKKLPSGMEEELHKVAKDYVAVLCAIVKLFDLEENKPTYDEVLMMVAEAFGDGIFEAIEELDQALSIRQGLFFFGREDYISYYDPRGINLRKVNFMKRKTRKLAFRKPEFMRNEELMRERIEDAKVIWGLMSRKTYVDDLLHSIYSDLIDEAAKAAGFFKTKDFIEWARSEEISLKA